MRKLIDVKAVPIRATLETLLQDKTTGQNIIWATDSYEEGGLGFRDVDSVDVMAIIGDRSINLQSRSEKALELRKARTKAKAEVFTPAWVCNRMINFLEKENLGWKNIFNTENSNNTWTVNLNKIPFVGKNDWQAYVNTNILEITCGEGPFAVSRYDAVSGELINPLINRIGILDRKLRVVNENTETDEEWLKWALQAYKSTYGYEYQGDNLLIARINLLLTFVDYYKDRISTEPDKVLLNEVADIISWNFWQMDAFTDTIPLIKAPDGSNILAHIKDWSTNEIVTMKDIKRENSVQEKPKKKSRGRGK